MRSWLRMIFDKAFTGISAASIVLMAAALVIIISPMIVKGFGAVFFSGTVEFRRLQYEMHGRGSRQKLEKELAEANAVRAEMYAIISRFRNGIDTSNIVRQVRQIYREYGDYLDYKNVDMQTSAAVRGLAKKLRDELCDALQAADNNEATAHLNAMLAGFDRQLFENTPVEKYVEIAGDYQKTVAAVDLSNRWRYEQSLGEVIEQLRLLFGPLPDEPKPALSMHQYGCTRMDRAKVCLDGLIWKTKWVEIEKGKPLKPIRYRRADDFAGTPMEKFFTFVEQNIKKMLLPRATIYPQYLIDDSTPGHFFGGIGPEILGTFIITTLAIVFALPLGVVSAGYLVECAGDNIIVRIIRICINTLAGVPSIVFGLFGLAFFVLYLFPKVGLQSKPCVLAASVTLAILILPVIIRASEEAIRTVPHTYREASLSLGAGGFKTFVSVTLPAAMPGILTGVILSLSRAAGETAPILFTGAVAFGPIPKSLTEPARTLSYGSYDIAVGDKLAALVPHQQFGMVTALILLVLGLNICAVLLRIKIAKKLRGV